MAVHAPVARFESPLAPLSRGRTIRPSLLALKLLQQAADLRCPIAAMATEGADSADLAGSCPSGDGLGIDPKQGGDLCRRQESFVAPAVFHLESLASVSLAAHIIGNAPSALDAPFASNRTRLRTSPIWAEGDASSRQNGILGDGHRGVHPRGHAPGRRRRGRHPWPSRTSPPTTGPFPG